MTREEARNELVLWRNRNSDNGYHYKFVEALTIAIKALEQQPVTLQSVQLKPRWIPTNPRLIYDKNGEQEYVYDGILPADQEDVLIITRLGFIEKVRFYDNFTDTCFVGYDGEYKGDVEAWMPLPEPYKVESEVKE